MKLLCFLLFLLRVPSSSTCLLSLNWNWNLPLRSSFASLSFEEGIDGQLLFSSVIPFSHPFLSLVTVIAFVTIVTTYG